MPSTVATLAAATSRPTWFYAPGGAYQDIVIVPGDGSGWGDPTKPGLLYCCGYGGTPPNTLNGNYGDFLFELTNRLGIPMYVIGNMSGWGNDADYAKTSTAISYYGTLCGVDINRMILIGGSMGGASICRYARSNKSKVLALIALEAVTDLTDIHTNDRHSYRAAINTAYGGNYSEAVYGATNNPATIAANGGFDGIKYLGFAAENDDICIWTTIQKIAADIDGGKWHLFRGTEHSAGMQAVHAKWVEEWLRPFGDPSWMRQQWSVGGDTVDQFFCSGTYTAPSYPVAVRVLAAGGGGAGGGWYTSGSAGGGGGGGEVVESIFNIHGPTVVTVGKPGLASSYMGTGGDGESSSMGLVTALGGGGGAAAWLNFPYPQPPAGGQGTGGGGGLGDNTAKGVAIGVGGDGAAGAGGGLGIGGGGGGAGGLDATTPNGTNGKQSDITGTATFYGGGGGGGVNNSQPGTGFGGQGGGGHGQGNVTYEGSTSNVGRPGVDGLGGGGGAGPKIGGWGTVIVRRGPSIPLIPAATTTLTSLAPNSGYQSGGVMVDLNGSGFVSGAKILVDLVPVQTTFVSATKLTSTYFGTLTTIKSYSVRVQNPNEDVSNALTYTVLVTPSSTATVTSLSPTTAAANSAVVVDVNGTGFIASTVALVNGAQVATTYVSATKVTTNFLSTWANEGVVQIGVKNPNEQASNTMAFTVTASLPPIPLDMWAWYDGANDASFVSGAGSEVTQWKNKQGTTARHLGVSAGNPTRGGSQNGNKFASVRIASGGLFYVGVAPSPSNLSIFTAARTVNTTQRGWWLACGFTYLSHSLPSSTSYGARHLYGGGEISDGAGLINTWTVQGYTRDTTTARIRRDGIEVVTSTDGVAVATEMWVGGVYSDAASRLDCDIGEILIYSRVLNGAEITQVETYLKTKWGTP